VKALRLRLGAKRSILFLGSNVVLRLGLLIIVGSHNRHRVAALGQVGGFPVHDADDLLLTLHYRAAG